MRLAALCLAIASTWGCTGMNMTPSKDWVPLASVAPPLTPEVLADPPPSSLRSNQPVTPGGLRVITYNVAEEIGAPAGPLGDAISTDPKLAAGGLLMLQEEMHYDNETTSRAEQLANELGLAFVYAPERSVSGETDGPAILSAYPLSNIEVKELPWVRSRRRIALAADVRVGDKVIRVIDLHLETFLNSQERVNQLDAAIRDAPDQVIVAGDFNTMSAEWAGSGVPVLSGTSATDQAPVIDSFMRSQGFDAVTAQSGPTEQGYGYESRLDSIYTRGIDATFGAVEHVGPSDHWPVWIDATLP